MVALLVAVLSLAAALKLAYWWWPSMIMLLAIPALVSVRHSTGNAWPFRNSWAVLRDPMRFVMYAIITASVLVLLYITAYSLQLDTFVHPLREVRFALLTLTLLLLLWVSLLIWLQRRTRFVVSLSQLALVVGLAFCHSFRFESIGYAPALTRLALLHPGLNRFAGQPPPPFSAP